MNFLGGRLRHLTEFSVKGVPNVFLLDYLWKLVMGNVAAGAQEPDRSEGRDVRSPVEVGDMSEPTPTLQKKKTAPLKLPMPPEDELEERFNMVLVSY